MKILLVDGEPGLAASLAQSLAEAGIAGVGTATSSDEAVDWINSHGGCDVLVTDVYLEPSDGLTLRETIQPHLPGMKTIFVSGYDVSAYADRMVGCEQLAKPVDPVALAGLIQRLLPRPTPVPVAAPPQPAATAQPTVTPRAVAATPRVAQATPAALKPVAVAPVVKKASTGQSSKSQKAAAVAQKITTAPATQPSPSSPKPRAQVASARPIAAAPRAAVASASPRPAVAVATPTAAVSAELGSEIELPPDDFVGHSVGNYQIEARIGTARMGGIYRARQTTVGRLVRLYLLDRSMAADPAAVQRFLSNASVKAKVGNPTVITVYEAGEADGVYFYSCEYIPCRSVRQLREAGGRLDETTTLAVLRACADALGYFGREKIQHELVSENAVLIGPQNRPRLANIAALEAAEEFDTAREMQAVGQLVLSALENPPAAPIARDLATSLLDPSTAPASWAAFLQIIQAREPKAAPTDAYKLDAQERAAIRMVEEAKKRQKRTVLVNMAVSLLLLAAALCTIWYIVFRPRGADVRKLDGMVRVPAGEFIYQNGQKITLPEFYISEHEVTIGQYAEFLKFLEENPDKAASFAHEKQPKGKSHVPFEWADMTEIDPPMPGYYARAKRWGKFREAALDVNSPVFGVDWFDAYAYAKWRGQRLPTEQEWEKAARGTDGRRFPWGNEPEPKRANTGQDFNPNPKEGGDIDGFKRWNPVDAIKGDRSPFGMIGASGNVSEWTASFDESTGYPVPVIRGGNWRNPDGTITRRVVELMDLQQNQGLGFRTASDTPPAK